MKGSEASRVIVSQIGSFLSAVYHPYPAAGPSPCGAYSGATSASVPYEMPAVWVSRCCTVIGRVAGTITRPVSDSTATVVRSKAGM